MSRTNETERVLASLPRGEGHETRVSLRSFGSTDIRVWRQDVTGAWSATPRGVTLRRHDLERVIAALEAARAEFGAIEPLRSHPSPAAAGTPREPSPEASSATRRLDVRHDHHGARSRPATCPARPARWSSGR